MSKVPHAVLYAVILIMAVFLFVAVSHAKQKDNIKRENEESYNSGYEDGYRSGYSAGHDDGFDAGFSLGYDEGINGAEY